MTDNPLGAFLRACREAVGPAQVGLAVGRRRRTPGLRRSELAELAGVSVEYLTRLERGRDRRPSPQVLAAIAGALQLDEDAHVHLLRLVKAADGRACSGSAPRPAVRQTVLALLDRIEPAPAVLIDTAGSVHACTEGFRKLADPVGALDTGSLPRFVFTDPRARAAFPDWDRIADEWAARLRGAADLGDPRAVDVATELALATGDAFVRRYAAATRIPQWSGTERWNHPDKGVLELDYEALAVANAEECRLVVYLEA